MATIRKSISVDLSPEQVWDAVRDVGALHTRLVPGFVTNVELEEGVRVVTFASGMVLRELIVDVDDENHRLVWSVVGEPFVHHNASVQVCAENGQSNVVWTADLLPHDLKESIAPLMEQGLTVMKQTLES